MPPLIIFQVHILNTEEEKKFFKKGAGGLKKRTTINNIAFECHSHVTRSHQSSWNWDFHQVHMGQKDQDGYYAEKCHIFFSSLEFKYTNLITVQIKSKNMQFTNLSIRVIIHYQNRAGYNRGPLGGREPRVPISRGKQKLLIETLCPRPPWGAPQCTQPHFVLKL